MVIGIFKKNFGNEIMSQNTLITIAICVFAFLIIFTILRSIVKATIVLAVIVLLFKVGWVYNSQDLRDKLNFDDFIKEEYQGTFYDKYDNFREKGGENEVIDTDKINDQVDTFIEENLNKKVKDYINKDE